MARADYSYFIKKDHNPPIIVVRDLNLGGMSVTNDIGNVIEDIAQKENLNPVEHLIIYRDSMGMWDGYDFATMNFIPLQATSLREAVTNYFNKEEK